MRIVIHTHARVGALRRMLNRLRGLPPETCHIDFEDAPLRGWKAWNCLAVCRTCGAVHVRRPSPSEAEVDDVIGRRGGER